MPLIRAGFAGPRCAGEGRGEPGQMGTSAFGTSSTSGETRRGLRVSPSRPRLATPNVESRAPERLAAAPASLGFEPLYEQYYTYTSRTLRHLGVPLEDIEDAAQEVWLAVHRQLALFA